MTTEKKKKNKSVERVKVNNTVMNDSNLNNQQVQIIFPPDTEIRKVKKKPKKKTGKSKSEKEKDELLEQLKEDLKQYDLVQEEAVQKKIKIPQELAVSTITKSDLKKNDDIKLFISDVVNKTQKIKELIAEAEKQLSQPSRGFPLRLGGGINRFANLPSIIPQQPEIVQPQIIPSTIPPTQPIQKIPTSDEKLEALKKIAEETKEQLEKSGVDVPINPPSDPNTTADDDEPTSPITPGSLLPKGDSPIVKPPVPPINIPQPTAPDEPQPQSPAPPPIDTSNYENTTLRNGQTVRTPPGWYDIYKKFEFFLKDLQFVTQQNQSLPGHYHIPLTKYNNFKMAQSNIILEYNKYFESIRPQDRKYLLNEPMINAVDVAMQGDFKKEPKDLVAELFTEQNIPFTKITQGNEKTDIETAIEQQGLKDPKKEKELKLFETKINNETNNLTRLQAGFNTFNINQIESSLRELNDTEEEMTVEFNALDQIVKDGVASGFEKFLSRLRELKTDLGKRMQLLPNKEDVPTLQKYLEDPSARFETRGINSTYAIVLRLFSKQYADKVNELSKEEKKKSIKKKLDKYLKKQPVAGDPSTG